jgi:geranylgeranylglycerol-phosphate geranylgeranyltransferase
MLSYLEMMRLGNCLMTALAVFAGGLLIFRWGLDPLTGPIVLLAMVSAFLIAGAGNVANDVADFEADKVNRPKRPIPSGRAGRSSSAAFAVFLFIAGLMLAASINWMTLFIALLNSAVLVGYSSWMQHKVYLGNIAISYLVASSFVFGGAAMGHIGLPLVLSAMAFFANLSREIVKDLEDVEGDRFNFIRRLKARLKRTAASISERFNIKHGKPVLAYNKKDAVIMAMVSLLFSVAISPLPYVLDILKLSYLVFLVPADFVMLAAVVQLYISISRKTLSKVSKMIKAGMLLGLLAFVAGVLF